MKVSKILALLLSFLLCVPDAMAVETRDSWLQPFDSASIWNTPIGSGAVYKPAGIPRLDVATDAAIIFKQSTGDRTIPVFKSSTIRCAGTQVTNQKVYLPEMFTFPPTSLGESIDPLPLPEETNPSAFLTTDRSLFQYTKSARCTAGKTFYGVPYSNSAQSLFDNGLGCCSSLLSPLGGIIRVGEMVGNKPIRHALKISIPAEYYYQSPGYRWRLQKASEKVKEYRGSNPVLTHGSLLAIDPTVTSASLNIKTVPGYKLFKALQDYGAYLSDAQGTDKVFFTIDQAAETEFSQAYGYPFESTSGLFYKELSLIVSSLRVIDNNYEKSIGGGGKPRSLVPAPIN